MSKPILLVPLILKNPSEYNLLTSKQIKFGRCCNATLLPRAGAQLRLHFWLTSTYRFLSHLHLQGWGGVVPHSSGFLRRKLASQQSCHIPRVHFHCVFSGTMRLGFTSQCEFTCDAASPCRMSFLFPRENAPHRNRGEVSKLEQRHMLTKEHCT